MPAKIIITNGITQRFNRTIQEWYNDFTPGYKRFKDIRIETKVGSQKIISFIVSLLRIYKASGCLFH